MVEENDNPTINTLVTVLKKAIKFTDIILVKELLEIEQIAPNNSWIHLIRQKRLNS